MKQWGKACPMLTHRYSCCEIGQLNSMLAKGEGGSRGWWSSPTYLESNESWKSLKG